MPAHATALPIRDVRLPPIPASMPSTTALALYGNIAGVGIAAASVLLSPRLAGKDVPTSALVWACVAGWIGGIIGATILVASAFPSPPPGAPRA